MPKVRTVLSLLIFFLGIVSTGFAQTVDSPRSSSPSSPEAASTEQQNADPREAATVPYDSATLTVWIADFAEWKTWMAEWGNRRERGWFTGFRDRRERPDPPVWLEAQCEIDPNGTELLINACVLLTEWRDYSTAQLRESRAAAVAQRERGRNTVWWEHVHVDVLLPALQWQASSYCVVGVHATTSVAGRLEVFIAPGAMLLNVPARNGGRAWKVAANYGIGYRLFDFPFPGGRQAALHVNLAKSWLVSDLSDVVARRSMDFIGFSMTFKQR
jgi:hypothetical protein